ncbi:N-acetyltransferase [Spirochaetia bacterium]|nr:N-acetyltransferase [Spirochaetia bacterium]
MTPRIPITRKNSGGYFHIEQLHAVVPPGAFSCSIQEYNEYLTQDALRSQNDHIALTWLLWERSTRSIVAYMSLIADAIKLSVSEKELHNLDYPFKTVPAMKVAKLAVSQSIQETYRGIGSFMLINARTLARMCNRQLFARTRLRDGGFLTVDADIENNESVLNFYEKNGFILNTEMNNKNRKTISMRKDIFA